VTCFPLISIGILFILWNIARKHNFLLSGGRFITSCFWSTRPSKKRAPGRFVDRNKKDLFTNCIALELLLCWLHCALQYLSGLHFPLELVPDRQFGTRRPVYRFSGAQIDFFFVFCLRWVNFYTKSIRNPFEMLTMSPFYTNAIRSLYEVPTMS
jgi:hypothetical protein